MGLTTKEISSSSFNDMISSVDRRSEYVENRAGANVRLNNFLTPYTLDDKSSILNAPCGYSNGVYPSLRPVGGENFLLQSNQFDTTWTPQGTVTGGETDKDGGTSAWSYTPNSSTSGLFQNITTGGIQTFSLYVKKNATYGIRIYMFGSLNAATFFDLNNGTVVSSLSGTVDASIEEYNYNWWRISVTCNSTLSNIYFYTTNNATTQVVGNIIIQDAQLEKGYRATPYTDTTTSPAINADFSFTRGSAATRVTKDGLIKNVQILSDELVQNGNFEEIGPEEVTNGDFSQIGSEEVTNGDFATDSDWTKQTGWTISGGKALALNVNGNYLQQSVSLDNTKIYQIQFEISDYVSGDVRVRFAGGAGAVSTGYVSGNNTHTLYLQSIGNTVFRFQGLNNFTASIDNVSVKEVGQDWLFSSQSEFTSEGARVYSSDGSYQYIVQNNILTIGKQYKVTFDVVSTNGASLASGTGAFIYDTSTTGSKTFYWKADDAGFMLKRLSGVTDVTITNISVKEVGQNWIFGGEAIIDNGLVSFVSPSNTYSYIRQDISSLSASLYRISVEVKNYVSGAVQVGFTGSNINMQDLNVSADGVYTIELSPNANGDDLEVSREFNGGAFDFDIDNVSVIEVTNDTDLPRIDYTNGTGSLLLEPQSTNLLPYSEDFTQWSASGNIDVPILVSEISPSGESQCGFLNINNAASSTKFNYLVFSTTSNIHTQSVFIKYHSRQWFQFASGGTAYYANFDIQNGVIGNVSACTATIEDYGNGWYKCSITTAIAVAPSNYAIVAIDSGTALRLPNSTGLGSYYVWGAQMEVGDYVSSYIPTNGSTVTRLADVCNNAGSSDLINSTEGVLYAEISALSDSGTNRILGISNGGDFNNSVLLRFSSASNRIQAQVRLGGVYQCSLNYDVSDATEFNKIAFKYKQNDFSLYVNGVERATDTSGNVITGLDVLDFDISTTNEFYGKTKNLKVFKRAMSDGELYLLTVTQYQSYQEMATALNYTL